ncbi:MAG: M3 family oligoendopeptidase, partial [Angelakisella sp.]
MKFSEYPYTRPDRDALFLELDSLFQAFENAQSFDQQRTAMAEFDNILKKFMTAGTIAYIRHTVNTTDKFYEAEQEFFDESEPLLEEKQKQFDALLLHSKFNREITAELGELALRNAELEQKGFSAEIIPLMQEENALCSEYQKLYASARIPLGGKVYTVAQLGALKESPDRALRKATYAAEGKFF